VLENKRLCDHTLHKLGSSKKFIRFIMWLTYLLIASTVRWSSFCRSIADATNSLFPLMEMSAALGSESGICLLFIYRNTCLSDRTNTFANKKIFKKWLNDS